MLLILSSPAKSIRGLSRAGRDAVLQRTPAAAHRIQWVSLNLARVRQRVVLNAADLASDLHSVKAG
jgi:hypothetical protein